MCVDLRILQVPFAKQKTDNPSKKSGLSVKVELSGFEPLSKHIRQKLSTCLFHD